MHYNRLKRNGNPYVRTSRVFLTHQQCVVAGCTNRIAGNGLCNNHWQQNKRRGDSLAPPLKERDWTADEDRTQMRIALRSPEPWVREAMPCWGRTYSACVGRAYDLRHGIKKSKAA